MPIARITVNIDLIPVPLGLEVIAVVAVVRPAQYAVRLRNQLAQCLEGLQQSLSLGNWYVTEPAGYRCFLTYQGRVVGVDLGAGPRAHPQPPFASSLPAFAGALSARDSPGLRLVSLYFTRP